MTDPTSISTGLLEHVEFLASFGIKFDPKLRRSRKKRDKASSGSSPAPIGHAIQEGSRNTRLASMAGSMRALGATEEQILARLQVVNAELCNPPLDDSEVESIAASMGRYAPSPMASDQAHSLNDTGNARRLVDRFGDRLRYVVEHDKWIHWNGTRWAYDDVGGVVELAKETAKGIYYEAAETTHDELRTRLSKHANASHNAPRIAAMVKLAESDSRVVVLSNDLDSHDELLGVANGVIDLRTGMLRFAQREDLITKHSPIPYDPRARCPNWLKFLKRVTNNDRELMRYLQRVVGYALSGLTDEQVLFFLYGSGANGKSTFLRIIQDMLGPDLTRQMPFDSLIERNQARSASNDLARLHGARAVFASEVEDGKVLAESQIKTMTGGDAISARFLYQELFEFVPKFKLFIAGNHKPVIKGSDYGIWRRPHLIPFVVIIPPSERDPKLLDKLRAELPGILAWAVRGHLRWRKMRLSPPAIITDAVKEYRDEMDVLGTWIKERCNVGPGLSFKAIEGYRDYKVWAFDNGYHPMTMASFGRKMTDRFTKQPSRRGIDYWGIELAKI